MKKIKSRTKRKKRNKIIQGLFLLPTIIFTLVISTNVNAGTQDSTLIRNTIDGIYAVAPLSDRTHLYNLEIYKMNNKISYCIEIGKSITTNVYNSITNINEQSSISKLSFKQLLHIKEIIYFGYGYPGHNDIKYYMAAQELIWEYLNNIDITWTNILDINGPKINVEPYKEEIQNLSKLYNSPYSFTSNINCKVGDKIVLTDTNNSLQYYEIISEGNQKAQLNNNTLTININNNYIGTDSIRIKRKNNYNDFSTLFYFDNSQNILSVGKIGDVNKIINLKIEGETLTTNLIDKENKNNIPSGQATLEGAVYEIYDKNNNLVSTFTTDKIGINTISNLYHDTYYIKQIKASKGYKLNDKIIEINLTSENNKLTLEEEVIKSTIEINKLYEIGDNYKREQGIKFEIYDNKDQLYSSITTTKLGPDKITIPYGKYTIKQVNTTYGYDKIKDINLNIDEKAETIIRYDLVDKKITSKLHIITKDKITLNNIEESKIKYKIKDKNTNEYLTYIDANNNTISEFSTNNSGELTIPINLSYGVYIIEQASTPTKYLENNEKLEVIINDKTEYSYINNQVVINVDFLNTPIVGKINVITNKESFITEANNYSSKLEKRPNVEIELYYNDKLLDNYKTNDNGKIEIENLKLGTYCVKEKNSNNKKCVELININNKTKIIEENIELTKKLKTTNIKLNNIDTNKNSIKGTTIELYKDDKLINTSITNESGIIIITNLITGKYCFKEIKVNSKYILNEELLCFDIKDTSKNINLTLINKLKEDKFKLIDVPNTLSNKKSYLILLPLSLILGAIIYKKNHKN